MRVIRVSNKKHINPRCPILEILTECTVVKEQVIDGELHYHLAERPPVVVGSTEEIYVYDAYGFAILPEKSADQMSEEKHEAIIYQR